LLGGAFHAVFGYLAFVAVYHLSIRHAVHYLVVVVVSQAIAITCAFFDYRFSCSGPKETLDGVSAIRLVYVVAAVLNVALMFGLVDWNRLDVLVSQAIATVVIVYVSYSSHRSFTFRSR